MNTSVYKIIQEAKRNGFKEQSDGTKLYGRTPHVAPEAWFHKVFPGIGERELVKLEKGLGVEIPKPHREFLLKNNGLILFSGSLSLDGYRKNYNRKSVNFLPFDITTTNVFQRPKDSNASQFFIGAYNWDGSLIYMDRRDYKIFRCERDSIKPLNKWNSLQDFLLSEVKRLVKLFDKQGREIDADMPTVP